ncbi:MAG: S9 family peptidase, partial [Gammaproteobacteria bacterium]|nr:S9 family peptidase [Gammaproteobacteria bacterium]
MKKLALAIACSALAPLAVLADNKPTLQDYARHAQFIDIKISPEGNYLAATSRGEDGNVRLTVLDIENRTPLSAAEGHGDQSINTFHWANNERLIMTLAREVGSLETPVATGEILAMHANGSRREILTGPRSRDGEYVFASVVDWLPDEPDSVLIYQQPFTQQEPFLDLYRMHVNSGRKRSEGRIPLRASREGGVQVITDQTGTPRVAMGIDPNDNSKRTMMLRDGNSWRVHSTVGETETGFTPLAFTADPNLLMGFSRTETDTTAIALYDLEAGEEEILAVHPNTDLMPIMSINKGRAHEVIGAAYEYGEFDAVFFGGLQDEAFAESVINLMGAFPQQNVGVNSATYDNNKVIVTTSSANHPRMFYLFDRESNQLQELANSTPWIDPNTLPQTQSITYESRDGLTIHALLTLPRDQEAKDLPLVLLPHGGPHGVRDSLMSMDRDAKVLAQHGYAVLQPNFRGSGGYGQAFEEAGYKRWGNEMINDMTDGVMHLIDQDIADGDRVCTYGGSYGGYAALQSVVREQDLYKCAIGFVGVYDLDLMFEEGDIPERESGLRYLHRVLPEAGEARNAQSPAHNADKINVPVFLIHGAEDVRVPLIQSERLRDAMAEHGKEVEWMVKEREGHGFYNPENNVERWQRMLAFLD